VAQRNEVRRSFGGLDAGNSSDRQDVALFQILVCHRRNRVWAHKNFASGNRTTLRGLFGPDVNHARLSLLIKVRQPRYVGIRLI